MSDTYIFADEAGDFTFNRERNVSRYFILCTVHMHDCAVAGDLIALRHKLAREGAELGDYFHATTDKQAVRDAVYETVLKRDFTIQATLMEKSKAQAHIRQSKPRFYQYGWFYHFRHGVSRDLNGDHDALVTAASIGTKKERAAFENAVNDVMRQTVRCKTWATDFTPCASHPCLQVADYCAWAIQRRLELNDARSYDLIKDRITYEYDLWQKGNIHYY